MAIATDDPIANALGAVPRKPGRAFKASTADKPEASWVKVLSIARSGAGKTFAIVGMLETGHRVFVLDTDLGGNGLRTVTEELVRRGEQHLLPNLAWYEFKSYKDVCLFLDHPETVEVNGKTLWEWNPDVLAWDGYANYQECHVTDYVLSLAPTRKEGGAVAEAREAGLQAEQLDWGNIRRATLFSLNQFLGVHNPNGKRIHKYMTCLMGAPKEDKLTGETKKGPLIFGAARDYMPAGFDLILTMDAVLKPGSKDVEYVYRCDLVDRGSVSKSRGLKVAAREPADMKALWSRIAGVEVKS